MEKTINFEKSLAELEAIVKELENGDLSLENALKQFEKGMDLAKNCQEILTQAEQKIEKISQEDTIASNEE